MSEATESVDISAKKVKRDTVSGFIWTLLSQFGVQFARLATLLILARFFLTPAEFGLVNMFVVITSFSHILIDFGFTQALVQKQGAAQKDFSTVFWLNFGTCLVISLALLASAPLFAWFYKTPRLTPIALALSPTFILYGLSSIQRVQLQREMKFRAISIIEVISISLAGIVACFMAYAEYGVWSLVAFYLLTPLVATLYLWFAPHSWRPTFEFSFESLKSISGFSFSLLGNNSLNYWARNLDKVLIGQAFGETQLGFYNQAYSLVLVPVTNFSNTFVRVLFPAFSKLRHDTDYVAKMFSKVSKTVLAVNLPVFLLLSIVTRDVVVLLLGQKWIDITSTLRIFAFVGLFISMRTIHSSVYMSHDKNTELLKINLVSRLLVMAGFFVAIPWGIDAVALWLLTSLIFSFIATSYTSCKILQANFKTFAMDHAKIAIAGGAGFAITYLIHISIGSDWSNEFIRLTICSVTFFAVYLIAMMLMREVILETILRNVRSRLIKPKLVKSGDIQ